MVQKARAVGFASLLVAAVNDRCTEGPSACGRSFGTSERRLLFQEARMFTRLVLLFFATTLVLSPLMAQTTAPARDPQALNLIASSLNALAGTVERE